MEKKLCFQYILLYNFMVFLMTIDGLHFLKRVIEEDEKNDHNMKQAIRHPLGLRFGEKEQ
jgi:hypothetical protein